MKRILFTALTLLLVVAADVSVPADRALVAIDDPRPGTAAALLDAGVTVIRDLGGYLVALAGPGERDTIRRLGFQFDILDDAPAGKTFYVATTHHPGVDHFGADAVVRRHSAYGSIIEATPRQADRLAGDGVDLARLFMTPMSAPTIDKPAPRTAPSAADPLITALVDSVSIGRISADVQRMQDFVNRYCLGDSVLSARDWIAARFQSVGIDSVSLHLFDPGYGENVVAVKPGVGHPEKLVIIGAHYDSITQNHAVAPGADDNASGTACVLECARLLAPHDFDYTLVFITFCGEELGLIGSEAYAAEAEANGDEIVAAINVDMIGYRQAGDATDLDIVSNASSQWLRDLLMAAAGLYVPGFSVVDGALPGGSNSDHASFWRHGFDAIMFWEDTGAWSPYIHTGNDLVGLSYNSEPLCENSVRTAVAALATLAEPFRVVVKHTPLENSEDTQAMHRVLADVLHADALDADSLYVRYTLTKPELPGAIRSPALSTKSSHSVPLTWLGHDDAYEALIPPQAAGTIVDYYIVAGDVNNFKGTNPKTAPADQHRFVVGTPTVMISEDFETDTGWTAGAPGDNATGGVWERGDPNLVYYTTQIVVPEDAHGGQYCYMTENAPGPGMPHGTADVDAGVTTLLSPVYDLSAMSNAWVRYYRWYANDTGGNIDDTWHVDVSQDGGTSWVTIESLDTADRQWTQVERFLGDYIEYTAAVRFRFVATDTLGPSIVEALIDDFDIVEYIGAVTATHPTRLDATLFQNYPNPFNPGTAIRFTVTPPGTRATLCVYNVAGQLVTTLVDNETVSGERVVPWDGRDRFGAEVASGVYFYRLDAGPRHQTRKMVVVR